MFSPPTQPECRSELEAAYRDHGAAVYRFALRLTGNQNDAEDLAMDAFIALYRSLAGIRDRSSLKTWLYRAVLNKWKNQNRKRPSEQLDPESIRVFSLEETDRLALWEAMEQVAPKLRVAVWLVKGEGLTHKEAAEVLKVPTGTVQDRVFRGMKKLRELMEPESEHSGKLTQTSREARI